MTYPRSHLVSEDEPGFFHVVSRCVRRAFLCGQDKLTGQCFEHRRQWIEARILELADCFAVSVYAFSVMSNHTHIVLHVNPVEAQALTNEDVARRWLTAFPGLLKHNDSPELTDRFVQAILGNPERLAELRKRLGSLSWFMKALNEPIARRANREDGCKGKFWVYPNLATDGEPQEARGDSTARSAWSRLGKKIGSVEARCRVAAGRFGSMPIRLESIRTWPPGTWPRPTLVRLEEVGR